MSVDCFGNTYQISYSITNSVHARGAIITSRRGVKIAASRITSQKNGTGRCASSSPSRDKVLPRIESAMLLWACTRHLMAEQSRPKPLRISSRDRGCTGCCAYSFFPPRDQVFTTASTSHAFHELIRTIHCARSRRLSARFCHWQAFLRRRSSAFHDLFCSSCCCPSPYSYMRRLHSTNDGSTR